MAQSYEAPTVRTNTGLPHIRLTFATELTVAARSPPVLTYESHM
jgi:hypothetical protein